jgi:peptidoglycan/xylan/chitin deacetylase (PgdA/CDA1 family)
MDDVAVRSCEDMAEAAIDAVLAKDTPINVGVIAQDLDKTSNSAFAAYIKTISGNSLVEIASHSNSHDTYTGHDLDWQVADMQTAQRILSGVTGVFPTAFIPPLNTFDSDTLDAMSSVQDLKVFSAKCVWNQDVPGEVTNCPSPGAVSAPNILVGSNYHLSAGAVLGNTAYWNNKIQPGNLSAAIQWIDTQILNQNYSVVLLHPSEFSASTECVSVDTDKIELLESLIDYGAGKYQFMTFQQAAKYFANDTSIFNALDERANAKFDFQAKFNLLIVFCFTGCVLFTACLSFCRTSTEQKIQKKDRIAAEMKRKNEIDSKLKNQRKQRDIEMTVNSTVDSSNPVVKGGNKEKKKINNEKAYSMI